VDGRRLGGDVEATGHLGVAEPLRQQGSHLPLSGGEGARIAVARGSRARVEAAQKGGCLPLAPTRPALEKGGADSA